MNFGNMFWQKLLPSAALQIQKMKFANLYVVQDGGGEGTCFGF